MKIGIISDTHGSEVMMQVVLTRCPDAALWLHAGDTMADAIYFEKLSKTPVVCVAGNVDMKSFGQLFQGGGGFVEKMLLSGNITLSLQRVTASMGTKKAVVTSAGTLTAGLEAIALTVEGHTIFLTHGHKFPSDKNKSVVSHTKLVKAAQDLKADIVVHGHTHIERIAERDGITIICPGSPARPKPVGEAAPSFMVMSLVPGAKPKIDVIHLK